MATTLPTDKIGNAQSALDALLLTKKAELENPIQKHPLFPLSEKIAELKKLRVPNKVISQTLTENGYPASLSQVATLVKLLGPRKRKTTKV
jgi:hypothetical protein